MYRPGFLPSNSSRVFTYLLFSGLYPPSTVPCPNLVQPGCLGARPPAGLPGLIPVSSRRNQFPWFWLIWLPSVEKRHKTAAGTAFRKRVMGGSPPDRLRFSYSCFFSLFSFLLPLVCCPFSILSLLNSLDWLDGPAGFARPLRRAGPPPWAAFPSAARRILHAIGRRHGRRRRWPTPAGSILPVCRKCCAGSSSPPVQSCQ